MLSLRTIPAEKPFLETLAAYLLRVSGHDPLKLADTVVLLPTRRSCRSLRDIMLALNNGKAMLLPRIQPIGDVDEEELFSAYAIDHGLEQAEAALPPAIPRLRRHLLLTSLIGKYHQRTDGSTHGIVQAAQLAIELASLFDQVEREQLDFAALADLAPDQFAEHWQLTLRFLDIITHHWPQLLRAEGAEDPVRRRNLLIHNLAALWQRNPPQYPVIAAGSTGSQPATAELLRIIANLPNGMVLLPGFDGAMPDEVWDTLDETHPQFVFKKLFERMQVERSQVGVLDEPSIAPTCTPERLCLFLEALKPPDLTHHWRGCDIVMGPSLEGVTRSEAVNQQEEARLIALRLREVLETPGKSAAVVTNDRVLARMIAAGMERYGVTIDDSAGKPLSDTVTGHFLRLIAEAALSRCAPVPLLALLKHPLSAAGLSPGEFRNWARALELYALRGPRGMPGLTSILHDLRVREAPDALIQLVQRLQEHGQEFFRLFERRLAPFAAMLRAHLALAEFLAQSDAEEASVRLWRGEEGEALATFIADLLQNAETVGEIAPGAYAELFETFISGETFRPTYGIHPRLHIYSPQEARLERADVMILAGLNEGVWPPQPDGGPWMSRPMQRRFGLPLPELCIGRAAHDFLMIAGARELVLSRAGKADGSPTVPSRWLLRLDTLLQALAGEDMFRWPVTPYGVWLAHLETPHVSAPFAPPAACPPVEARPRKLSVTAVETWQRDPYAIYAAHVLGLRALDPLDQEPDAASFGSLIHLALEAFITRYPDKTPPDPCAALLEAGQDIFAPLMQHPAVRGFWWPRYQAITEWVAAQEIERRPHVRKVLAELKGSLALSAPAGPFTLTTRIDRAEANTSGTLTLIDYKTGAVPASGDILSGLSSQMPLEALIVQKGALTAQLPGEGVGTAEYWRLAGEYALNEAKTVGDAKKTSLHELITRAEAGVQALIDAFDNPNTPYLACPDTGKRPRYNDYDHLERLPEWSLV